MRGATDICQQLGCRERRFMQIGRKKGPKPAIRSTKQTSRKRERRFLFRLQTSRKRERRSLFRARFPAMARLPGCIGMRKMVSVVGWAKHAVIYEFVSVEARATGVTEIARLYPEMEAWTNRFIPHLVHSAGSPNVARRIWPA